MVKACESVQSSFTAKTRSPEQSIVMRPNGHSHGRGYNSRLMSFICCAPQAPSCQPTFTVLKIKYRGQMHGVMIAIEYSYKLDRKIILIYGAN